MLKFVFYGIQAASPTIAALIVLRISGTCKEFGVKYFHFKHLLKASVLPVLIACFTMFMAKLIFCFVEKIDFTIGSVSAVQFVIILWALIAEEIGWRGYLLDLTDNNLVSAMLYHFAWNLFLHVFAINPNDNGGNALPYIILVFLEILIVFGLSLIVKKKGFIDKNSSKVS